MTLVTEDSAGTTRDELRRRQREAFAMRSGWPELNRSDLTFTRFTVTHEPTGDEFSIYKGEVDTAIGTKNPASAFYYDQTGGVVFLERRPGSRR